MSSESGSTQAAGAAPAAAVAASASAAMASPTAPPVRTYTHTTFLSTLTDKFTEALLAASDAASSAMSGEERAALVPDYYVEATRSALRAVLAKNYTPEVAAEYAAALASQANSPTASPVDAPVASDDAAAAAAPPRKPIRTYIDGCFDIMHSGHFNAIRQAKALTDILVVGVHSDAEILKHKGPPVMNEQERLAVVKACKWVDEVVFDTPYDPSLELLIKLNCDFCVHGDDMSTTADGKDAYAEVKAAGRMKVIKRTEGVSTTDLVGRLLLMTKNHHLSSPARTPLEASPSFGALSSKFKDQQSPAPPTLSLEPPAMMSPPAAARGTASPARKLSDVRSPGGARGDAHYSSGLSNFLPTTWRITQFSNHRTPSPSDRIVYIDGAFDLFHVGHIETLKKAKDLGSFLYVGIHDDATVNKHKGRNYPVMDLHERVMNVLSCKYVDEVVIGAPWVITKDLLTTLNIHVVASGTNTKMDADVEAASPASMQEPYAVPRSLGIFREIETTHSLNTDMVVRRIIDNRLKYENRNAKRSAKEIAYLNDNKQYIAEI